MTTMTQRTTKTAIINALYAWSGNGHGHGQGLDTLCDGLPAARLAGRPKLSTPLDSEKNGDQEVGASWPPRVAPVTRKRFVGPSEAQCNEGYQRRPPLASPLMPVMVSRERGSAEDLPDPLSMRRVGDTFQLHPLMFPIRAATPLH